MTLGRHSASMAVTYTGLPSTQWTLHTGDSNQPSCEGQNRRSFHDLLNRQIQEYIWFKVSPGLKATIRENDSFKRTRAHIQPDDKG